MHVQRRQEHWKEYLDSSVAELGRFLPVSPEGIIEISGTITADLRQLLAELKAISLHDRILSADAVALPGLFLETLNEQAPLVIARIQQGRRDGTNKLRTLMRKRPS